MFNKFRNDTSENVRVTWNIAWWLVIIGIILIVCTLGGLALMPTVRNLWIEQFRSSNQYVTTKQTLLFELMDEHQRLESKIAELSSNEENNLLVNTLRGQAKGIMDRMENEARLLQPNQVPNGVRIYITEHGDR